MIKEEEKIDAEKIMKEINFKADKRRMAGDLEMLDGIDVRDYQVDEEIVVGRKRMTEDDDCMVGDNFRMVKSHRKGFLGKVFNFILRKVYFTLRIFFNETISAQESLNVEFRQRGEELKKGIMGASFFEKLRKQIQYPNLGIDYVDFENRFRGEENVISERQRLYLRFFKGSQRVMDIGCGRGEFIELLEEVEGKGFGVELDKKMVKECVDKGLEVYNEDVLSFIDSTEGEKRLDGVFCAQVVEHLHMDYMIKMLRACYELLVEDKYIVLETINIKSLSTFTNSVYMDPTHVNPVHPETLKYILESIGFREVSFIFSSEFKDEEKLAEMDSGIEGAEVYNGNVRKLNELLFAPQDYAVIGKK